LEAQRSGTGGEIRCSGQWMRWWSFYTAGEAAEGRGDGQSNEGQWCFIKAPVTEEEVRGWPFDEGGMKGVGRRFDSAPSGCRRVAHGARGPKRRRWLRRPKVGEDPRVG
jgi:hypothetical protein